MRLRLAAATAVLGLAAIPFAAHAGCTQDLIADPFPSDPHSITQHYLAYVACVV